MQTSWQGVCNVNAFYFIAVSLVQKDIFDGKESYFY